jgi:hypothetical protein
MATVEDRSALGRTRKHRGSQPCEMLPTHPFNDIRDRVRYQADMASMEHTGRRNRGLQNRWEGVAL